LEEPVLDAERLLLGQAAVPRDALGAPHHADRVDVELAGDARLARARSEAPHADARREDDRRRGVAHRRRVGLLLALVVRRVLGAERFDELCETLPTVLDRRRRRQVEEERTDLRAQEMVRAARPEAREGGRFLAREEVYDDLVVAEVPDDAAVAADE